MTEDRRRADRDRHRAGDAQVRQDEARGDLVERGRKGVWIEPLLPGKYAFNTFAGKVLHVPTTNAYDGSITITSRIWSRHRCQRRPCSRVTSTFRV